MRFTCETFDAFRRVFSIEMDAEEVAAAFEYTYADFAFRFPFPDHAAGQVPADVVVAAFGTEAVASCVAETLCKRGFGQALDQADVVKIGEPDFSYDALPEEGAPFAFSVQVDCSPLYPLSSYEPVQVRLPAMGDNAAMAPALQKMRENEALHALQQRLRGTIPEIMIDAQEQIQLQDIYAKANAQNMPFEKYLIQQRIDPQQFKKELEEQAEEMVRRNLALDAWAHHVGIEATDEMIRANFARSGVPYPELEEAQWRESGRIVELRQAIRRAGALRDIMQGLVVETI